MIFSAPAGRVLLAVILSVGNTHAIEDCTRTPREFIPFPNFLGEMNPSPAPNCKELSDRDELLACQQRVSDLKLLHGEYMRVDPTGEWLLLTKNSESVLVHLVSERSGKRKAVPIRTRLLDETYGVGTEEGWLLLVSPDSDKIRPMEYYPFKTLVENATGATPLFTDDDLNNYYHSVGLLDGSTKAVLKLRVMIFKSLRFRDITVEYQTEGAPRVTFGEIRRLCENLKGRYERFEEPNLSRNGTELFAQTTNLQTKKKETHIIKILDNHGTCGEPEPIGIETSKANDSFHDKNKKGKLTFTTSDFQPIDGPPSDRFDETVAVYDRDTGKVYRIGAGDSANYPGFTRDGRVIYHKKYKEGGVDRAGVVVTAPDLLQHCDTGNRPESTR